MDSSTLTHGVVGSWLTVVLLTIVVAVAPMTAAAGTGTVDDFEDGDLSEYTNPFGAPMTVQSNTVQNGSQALNASSVDASKVRSVNSDSGLANYPKRGDKFTGYAQMPGSRGGNARVYFGLQETDSNPDGYFISFGPEFDRIELAKRVGGSTTYLDKTSATIPEDEWLKYVVNWADQSISVTVYDSNDNKLGQVSALDTKYSSGGVGFGVNSTNSSNDNTVFHDNIKVTGSATNQSLVFRNVSAPGNKVSESVTATFFFEDGKITRKTDTGVMDVADIDINNTVAIEVSASNYTTRTVRFDDLNNQHNIYMLNSSSQSTVDLEFVLDDNTGLFGEDTIITVERPITLNGETKWREASGDEPGPAGFQTTLEKDQKYRITINNQDGDSRILGTYTPKSSETVVLEIGEVLAVPQDNQSSYDYNTSYKNVSGPNAVIFEYNDTDKQTDWVNITIHEKGNKSNQIYQQNHSSPSTIAVNASVGANADNKTWVVDVQLKRGGETQSIRDIVGPQRPQLGGLDSWIRVAISLSSIWIVAGLFSQLNSSIGAVVVAALGGLWYFVGFLPASTGAGIVVLAFFTAFILYARDKGGSPA